MLSTLRSTLLAVSLGALYLTAPACVGQAPGPDNTNPNPDPNPDPNPNPNPDPNPNPTALNVTGMVMDYFTGDALAAASINTEGLNPALTATSETTGAYSLADVPPGSTFYASAVYGDNYYLTRNEPIVVVDQSVPDSNLYVLSMADVQRQYATVNMAMTTGTAPMSIADLRKNNGDPMIGIPAAGVTLLDALQQPVGDGPYFFAQTGDIATTALEPASADYGKGARVAFLNVPPGDYTLAVNYLDGQGNPQVMQSPVHAVADGISLILSGGQGVGGGGGGGGPSPTALSFRNDIYPVLQKASLGGIACANCHTAGGLGAVLPFDGTADDVYAAIMARPGVVDLQVPVNSMLLSKPLYEDPPNHPNATFLTTDDPYYVLILTWIGQGALLDVAAQ